MRGQNEKEDGGGGAGGNDGGITFEEFHAIMGGTAKLPSVKVPVGFD